MPNTTQTAAHEGIRSQPLVIGQMQHYAPLSLLRDAFNAYLAQVGPEYPLAFLARIHENAAIVGIRSTRSTALSWVFVPSRAHARIMHTHAHTRTRDL